MILINYKKNLLKFLICVCITLIILLMIVNIVYTEPLRIKSSIINSNIQFMNENTYINVNYPRFKNEEIDKIVSNYIYDYVRKFKLIDETKTLKIDYDIYYKDNYANIVFYIKNNLDDIKYKNILLNLDNKNMEYITNVFDKDFLEKSINEISYYKYEYSIYNKIKQSNINNHTYLINENMLTIYFYDINFENIDYYPYITINLIENTNKEQTKYYKYDKFIVFTFDNSPSKYTEEILKTLQYNDSTATFFMLGNRMKYNQDVVLKVYNSNNEIESNTYSYKNLTKISDQELEEEINSTEIIYNKITGETLKYIRPPYGNYNKNIISLNYPLILWSIDSKDTLYRDSNKIYNNVIEDSCDGCIVLLHDIHLETVEAVKKLIPSLNNLGYNVVSLEELIKLKKYIPINGEIIRKIK